MNRSSLRDSTKQAVALAASVKTVDANGVGVDTQGYEQARLIAIIGLSGDVLAPGLNIQLEVEESDDNITFTDVADADLTDYVAGTNTGTFAKIDDPAEDEAVYKTNYIGSKRYIRCVYNVTGVHAVGTPAGVISQLGSPRQSPPA